MNRKIMLSLLVILFFSQQVLPMNQAIRVDSSENNELVVNFLTILLGEDVTKYINDFKEWRKERIDAYKKEYNISDSDRTVDDVYIEKYLNKYGSLHPDCCFRDRSTMEIIPIRAATLKYEIICSCQYQGHPQWNLKAFGGYSQAEVEAIAEQIRDQCNQG